MKSGIPNLAGRAKSWASAIKLHDLLVFGTYEVFKTQLRQTFEPPRAEFRALAELPFLQQGKRNFDAYAQHTRYLVRCIVSHPIDEHTQVTVFMKSLADGSVKTLLELETLDQAISVAE